MELLPFSQILPDWSLPDESASLEEDGFDLNILEIFDEDDLLPPWIGTDHSAETLLSENLQDFWGNPPFCKQKDALTKNQLEGNLSSTFLFPTLPPTLPTSTIPDKPNDLLTKGFEDLWDAPLLTEDLSDITNGSLDESFSLSLITSPSSSPSPSSPPALTSSPLLLPSPPLLQEHDYSLSPSLLPSADEAKPKLSGGKSILKSITRNIHITDIIQGHKKVLQRTINPSKKQVKTHSQKKHNERERFRRGHLKLELERLRDLLPSLAKSKRPAKKRDS